jgi:hypothetical protein
MSWLSKQLNSTGLGGINQVFHPVNDAFKGVSGTFDKFAHQWDVGGRNDKFWKPFEAGVGIAAGGLGGMAMGGGAGAAGSQGGALTEFGTGPGQDASLTALNGGGASSAASGGTASAPKSSPKGSFIRTALNALKQGGGGQQQPMPMQPPQAPPPDSTALPPPPDASLALRTNLSALQNVQPQQVGGADLRR